MIDEEARLIERLMASERAFGRKEAADLLRREADRYQHEDGSPGDLATTWGWRTIAAHLRTVAQTLERCE